MSEHLSKDSLAEGLHTKFRLSFEPEKMIELELVEVNESGGCGGTNTSATLTFNALIVTTTNGTGLNLGASGAEFLVNGGSATITYNGGFNSSVTVVLPGGGLASGASINVRFLLGVQQEGSFRLFVNVEALPGPSGVPDNLSPALKGAPTGKQSAAGAGEAEQQQPQPATTIDFRSCPQSTERKGRGRMSNEG